MRAITFAAALVLVPVLASAQQPCTSDADSAVDAIYRRVLERPAGGEGNERAAQLRNGQTSVRELVREIAKSPEHRQRFLSNTSPSGRVDAVSNLYRHLLGRAPDQAGLNSHVEALARNDINTIIDTMINSAEYQQQFGDDRVPGGTVRYCRNGASSAAINNEGRGRFRNMDRNGNGVIERDEWNGNRGSFEQYDWNNDGILSGDELRRGAQRPAQATPRDDRGTDFNSFANLDTDRSGTITPNEWRWTLRSFDRYDADGDKLITRREFEAAGGAPGDR
jgi:Ca2+-binding EF-hand superfamily protein